MIGTQLGSYELLEEIGKGGMATVYRAYQRNTDRHVAVKIIHKSIVSDELALERFRREARLIARLENPHILPVYDFDGTHDPPYIVMRFLDSGTLKDVLGRQRLPLNEVGFLLRQIANALDYAHRQGVVHRDIKPSNILLDREGNAFVSDFGIARMMGAQATGGGPATQTGAAVGTPDYMAPEQAMGRSDVDGRADVYSLGVVVFQMITGRMPFTGETPMAVLLKHIQEPPPHVRALNPDLPMEVDSVLMRTLSKDVSERPRTSGDLAEAVIGALGGTVVTMPVSLRAAAKATGPLSRRDEAGSRTPSTPSSTSRTPTEQNKLVTVLYADAAEYAEIVEAEENTEAARRALRQLWERAVQIITARGGAIVAQGENDLTAVWGIESAGEDDPERAVRAALDLQEALRALGRGALQADPNEPLPLRLGVNTGLALLAPSEKGGTHTATGATLTLAQRLAENAPGAIRIAHDTFREVRGIFDLNEGEPLKVRGRKSAEPLQTYRVTGVKSRAFRVTARGVEGVETRMVGREAELKQLESAYLDAVEESETQVVTVIGEAGLGKSRLLDEFRKWTDLRPEKYRIFVGRATVATTQRPYALLRDVLSFRFQILDNDPVDGVRQKMEQGLAELLGGAEPEMAHLVGHLAGFDFNASPHVAGLLGDPKQLANRARQLFFRFFEQLCVRQPAVIHLEDLHHADDASLDLFNELVTRYAELPMVMVCLARPTLLERRPTWGGGQKFHKRLTLEPLDKRDSRDLAREVLKKVGEPPKALRDLLVERAEGNPLFMEELVKMLIEDRVILKDSETTWHVEEARLANLRVPPTLKGLLQARFDTLLYPEKLTLQRAAVIGRIFFDGALAALDAADEAHVSGLPEILHSLNEHEFIFRRESSSFAGNVEYIFGQNMLRDLIYDSLLDRQRRIYHAAMAGWLAASERAEEYLALIAEHYEKGGEAARAAEHLEQAGDKAMRVSAFGDAINFYTRALGGARSNVRAALKQAEAHYRLSNFDAARDAVLDALGSATLPADRAQAMALLGEVGIYSGEYASAASTLAEALPLARASGDQAVLAQVLFALGDVEWRLGKLDEARRDVEESLAIARAIGDTTRTLYALNRLGTVLLNQGDSPAGEQCFKEVHALALAAGNRERAMTALNNLGAVADERGDLTTALEYTKQALALARELGVQQNIALYLVNLAGNEFLLEDRASARAHLREGLALAWKLRVLPWAISGLIRFAEIIAVEGGRARALALYGLAKQHPAFTLDHRRDMEKSLVTVGFDPAAVEAEMAEGAKLDLEATINELLAE